MKRCYNFTWPRVLYCIVQQDTILALDSCGCLWLRRWQRSEGPNTFKMVRTLATMLVEHSIMDGWDSLDHNEAIDKAKPERGMRMPTFMRFGVIQFATFPEEVVKLTGDKQQVLGALPSVKWLMSCRPWGRPELPFRAEPVFQEYGGGFCSHFFPLRKSHEGPCRSGEAPLALAALGAPEAMTGCHWALRRPVSPKQAVPVIQDLGVLFLLLSPQKEP